MTIKPLANNIIFQFINGTGVGGMFHEITESGFHIAANTDDSAKLPRWAKVISVGDEVLDVVESDYILIEALMWTDGSKYENETYWKTNEDKVLVVSKELPERQY